MTDTFDSSTVADTTVDTVDDPARDGTAVDETAVDETASSDDQADTIAVDDQADTITGDAELLEDAEVIEIEAVPEAEPSPFDRPGHWYVVHTYAGYENKVKSNLASRVRSMNVEDRIFEVVIPMEDVIEFKNGRKVVVQKKVFPGYLLVRMGLDDDAWYVVRNTPGVTGFVGSGARPTHLSRRRSRTSSAPARRSKARRPRRRCGRGSSTRWASRSVSSPVRSPTSTA